jgi:hypothetical protein
MAQCPNVRWARFASLWQVSRIMRKENFLTAMLNKEVLDLRLPMLWLGQRVMLTKILEWNLYWCARVPSDHHATPHTATP